MRASTCLIVSVFLVALASCQNENKDGPKFITRNQTIEVNKTDTITLPCIFDKLPSYYQVEWNKLPGERDGPSDMKHPLAIGNILTDQKDFQNRKSVAVNHKVTDNFKSTNKYNLAFFTNYCLT